MVAADTTASFIFVLNHADRSRSSNVPALFHTLAADREDAAASAADMGTGVLEDETAVDAAAADDDDDRVAVGAGPAASLAP